MQHALIRYRLDSNTFLEHRCQDDDWLTEEVPVALVFNGISHAVMLASPSDLDDFALGFALTEGLIASVQDCYGIEVRTVPQGMEVQLAISARAEQALKARRRSLAGRTGCGLCGVESLTQVTRAIAPLTEAEQTCTVKPELVLQTFAAMRPLQNEQNRSGCTHAAAWCDADGRILLLREDVGRHNALDKIIGAASRAQLAPSAAWIAITSRASFEMVQKCAAARVGLLAAASAPTALAVRQAQQLGLALAGFVRGHTLAVYTHAERFIISAEPPMRAQAHASLTTEAL